MATVVVVDDEYFMRMGIKTIANQKEKGHIVVGEAENGNMAVEKVLELNPDIVFLDITMPGMDGLEVLKTVREKGYSGYIAMLTCHEDFRFAQQSLRMGADDYILKNELAGEEMLNYLNKVEDKINKNRGRRKSDEAEQRDVQHFYRENFLKNVLKIGGFTKEEFIKGSSRYGIHIKANGIYLILVHINDWEKVASRYRESNLQVLFSTIDNMMQEIFRGYPEMDSFYTEPYLYHIMFSDSSEHSALKVEENLRKIINSMEYHFERVLDIDISIAVYRNTYPIEKMNQGYKMALRVLGQKFFHPERKLFWQGVQETADFSDMSKLEKDLKEAEEKSYRISETIEKFLDETKNRILDVDEFISCIEKSIRRLEEKYGVKFEDNLSQSKDIKSLMKSLKIYERLLKNCVDNKAYSFLIKQAMQIIDRRFTEKLTLEDIAEELGISAGYFSRIFSEETGETFSNYLIRKRIDYAKELIENTNDKFYEIAEKSGFNSAVHFNNMFKKICGVTPNQYRKEV